MYTPDETLVWKKLSSVQLHNEPWFTVRKESVELPSGVVLPDYYVLDYPEWINVIPVTKDKKIVLVEQYRYALGRVSLEIPAGVCEKEDGSLLASAQRELLEETGYGKGNWRYFSAFSANAGTHTNLSHTFVAEDVEPVSEQSLDAGEAIKVHVLDREEVLQMLLENKFVQSLLAAPLWQYFYQTR